jgi:hypothetical protein
MGGEKDGWPPDSNGESKEELKEASTSHWLPLPHLQRDLNQDIIPSKLS